MLFVKIVLHPPGPTAHASLDCTGFNHRYKTFLPCFLFRLSAVAKSHFLLIVIMSSLDLPQLPVPHKDLARYIVEHPGTPMIEMLQPYREYEAKLRQLYAQDPENGILKDPYLNVLPLFACDNPEITIRARDRTVESQQDKDRFIMSLPDEQRRTHGSPAVVQSLKEFQHNFNVFSESSLVDLDWSNVVASGSSVVNCLLPVPNEYNASKRTLREFYHEK